MDARPFIPMANGKWGVWDRRHRNWAVGPQRSREMADELAQLMCWAYAAGSADTVIAKAKA